jgi:hypothetical protein
MAESVYYHQVQRQRSALRQAAASPENQDVILQFTEDGFRLCAFIREGNILCGLDEVRFTRQLSSAEKLAQLEHFLPDSLLADQPYAAITIAVEPLAFTLIPADLFSEDAARFLLEISGDGSPEDRCFSELVNAEMLLYFSVDKNWCENAAKIFSKAAIAWTCNFSGLLRFASGPMEKDGLLARIGSGYLHTFGRKDGKLCFFNRYTFRTEQDLLYYFLLSMEQTELDPEKSEVQLCGSIMTGSLGFEKISRYAGNLRFVIPEAVQSELPPSSGIRHPQYFDLLTLLPDPVLRISEMRSNP